MKFKNLLGMSLAATAVVLQGCAGFPANKVPMVKAEQLAFNQSKKTKVYSRWELNHKTVAINETVKVAAAAVIKKQFDDQLKATNCCVIVESASEADVVVKGVSHNENNPAAMIPALITGFSLYTIPSWTTITVHVTADAAKADQTFKYDVSDSMTMVQWLPMMFAFPFKNPFPMEKDITDNVYKTIILNMKNDKVIE